MAGWLIYHAADNSFPKWKEYNDMIGLGGWNGRNEKDGTEWAATGRVTQKAPDQFPALEKVRPIK